MSDSTLSIQEVNGFPVLVCQSQDRREVYEVQRPEAQAAIDSALPMEIAS